MYCLDWNNEDPEDPSEIVGTENTDDYSRLDIVVLPCNYIHTMLGYSDDSI